ncbi:MAG: 2-phospho-L-lactate transferase, partial [Bacillota bacterium]
ALPGVRESLARRRRRVAVSPLAAGRAFKGPAVEMMQGLGLRPEAAGVAAFYRGLIDLFVIDPADEASAPEIEAMGMRPVVAPIALQAEADRRRVATLVLEAAADAA